MPTYEYACRSCGEQLEVVQSFTDDPLTTCGACGGPLRKVFGAVGISFKGSGFYKTDSRKGSSSTSATPSTAESGGKDGGEGGAGKKDGAKEPVPTTSTSGGDGAGGAKAAAPAAASKPSSAPSSTG